MMDMTERKQAEERLSYLASCDSLTNLPNRILFYDRLNQVLSRAPWSKRLVGVLFLDLDRFKIINDTLGHNVGDELLKAVAERLKGCVRAGDTVARLGGDEFTVILDDVAKEQDVTKIAQKILDALSKPYRIEGHELFTTTSIGISLYPHDGETAETLLKNADIAMYRAKEQGKNNFQHYSSAMNAKASERLSLENGLRHALEGEELRLLYQPQLDLKSGQIIGMEALVRWQHPEMGLLSPAKFIPVAEETGLIIPMGEWVLRTACAQNRAWQTAGYASMRIAVNFSARQFQQQNMIKMVSRVLQETGLAPHFLELELTESIIMKNAENTIATLYQLHEMGLEISIDDFGTGYSSLSYLRRFPINRLKVDQSFVRDIAKDPINAEIVNAIITMAHSLKIKVIAESVETAEQLRILRSLECDEMQGYILSPPLSPQEATKLLAEEEDLSQRLPHQC
jgi:diguanylate cyclase (GGDEF)-like protein